MEATNMLTQEELKNNCNELVLINEKQEKRIRYIETEATKIVLSYVFLQAIIFLSSSPIGANYNCELRNNNRWVPFSLSLLVVVLFGVPIAAKIHEWLRTAYQFDWNLAGIESMRSRIISSSLQRNYHKGGDDRELIVDGAIDSSVCKVDVVKLYKRNAFACATAFALLGYTVVILTACARSTNLCHRKA